MSWKLRKPDVSLRVTRFLPEIAPASAGLSDEDRQAHRKKRAKETSFRDGQLSRDGRFRWSAGWGRWVPTGKEREAEAETELNPLGPGPLWSRHTDGCLCGDCLTAGQHYADYLKARRLQDEI